jgi:antitoxin FitA
MLALLSMIAPLIGELLSLIAGERKVNMAQLVVRNLSDDLVKALKQRAAKHNRSAEQEHREILEAALRGPRRRSLASVLASMPNVGKDEDFARQQSDSRR